MKSLYDYDFLQNEVFYRSEFILKYLERHHDLTDLDKDAIANTILDALVTKGLIDPEKQSLDLESLAIANDLDHITYNKTPNVMGIPLRYKEEIRHKCFIASGSLPVSVYCARPAGHIHICVYDINLAFSYLFPSFKFLVCDYDSPTRKGTRATERPFLEVCINGEQYLVDLLTKRIFKASWFKEKFNLIIVDEISSESFTPEQVAHYRYKMTEDQNLAPFLSMADLFPFNAQVDPRKEEIIYEIEQTKKYFPEAWEDLKMMRADMRRRGYLVG